MSISQNTLRTMVVTDMNHVLEGYPIEPEWSGTLPVNGEKIRIERDRTTFKVSIEDAPRLREIIGESVYVRFEPEKGVPITSPIMEIRDGEFRTSLTSDFWNAKGIIQLI